MKIELEVEPEPGMLARLFCEMTDDQQAEFFVEVGKISGAWGAMGEIQWNRVGRHLRECACATDAARDIIANIVNGIHAA